MSLHKKTFPRHKELTQALKDHGLEHDTPSQLADAFRLGWQAFPTRNSADLVALAEKCGAEVGRYEGQAVWIKFHSQSALEAFAAALAVPQPSDEREAFEAWIAKDGGDLSKFGSGRNIHYANSAVNNAWTGWQARALRATPASTTSEQAAMQMLWDDQPLEEKAHYRAVAARNPADQHEDRDGPL